MRCQRLIFDYRKRSDPPFEVPFLSFKRTLVPTSARRMWSRSSTWPCHARSGPYEIWRWDLRPTEIGELSTTYHIVNNKGVRIVHSHRLFLLCTSVNPSRSMGGSLGGADNSARFTSWGTSSSSSSSHSPFSSSLTTFS